MTTDEIPLTPEAVAAAVERATRAAGQEMPCPVVSPDGARLLCGCGPAGREACALLAAPAGDDGCEGGIA